MIENLCKRIKDKREESGYSIEEVVKKTKLHPSVIRDIENCNFGNITPIYIKGFVKIYAAFLGVEVKDELGQINAGAGSKIKKPKEKKALNQNPILNFFKTIFERLSKAPPQIKKNILLAGVILIILWLGFLGIKFSFRKVLSFFQNRPKVEKQKPAEEVNNSEEPLPAPVGQSGRIRASLTVRKPCFIKVMVDKEVLFEGILNKGEVETWQAEEELEFKISDGSAVYLEVDGNPIPKLSSIHKPIKSLIINSSGITVNK